jgi:hypothetical protein
MTHCFFPGTFQKSVKAFLLCHLSIRTKDTLGKLPESIIIEIISLVLSSSDMEGVAKSFRTSKIPLATIGSMSQDTLQNRLLGMEICVQRRVASFFSEHTYIENKNKEVNSILRYAESRVGSGVQAQITTITEGFETIKTYKVCISYTVHALNLPENSEQLTFWKHESGRAAWTSNSQLCFIDSVHPFDIDDSWRFEMRQRGYVECSLSEYQSCYRKQVYRLQKRVERVPKTFYITTTGSLNCWESSLKRLLRIPKCTQAPYGLTGLLISVAP